MIHIDNIHLVKKMDQRYQDAYNDFYKVLLNEDKSNDVKNIIANIAIEQLMKANEKNQNPDIVLPKDKKYRQYLKSIIKSKEYIQMKEKIKNQDLEKITITGIWLTISLCLVLMFFKCIITNNYVINFSVDLIIAAISLILVIQNYKIRVRIIERYKLGKYFYFFDTASLVCCIIAKVSIPGQFDVSYVILVINYFVTKKKAGKKLDAIQ